MLPSRMMTMFEGVIKVRFRHQKHYRASVRWAGFSHITSKRHATNSGAEEYGRAVAARLIRRCKQSIKLEVHKGYIR